MSKRYRHRQFKILGRRFSFTRFDGMTRIHWWRSDHSDGSGDRSGEVGSAAGTVQGAPPGPPPPSDLNDGSQHG